MFCEKCGAKLEEGSAFCMQCGAPVEDAHTAAPRGGMPEKKPWYEEPVQEPVQKQIKQKNKKNMVPVYIGAGVVIVALVVGIIWGVTRFNKKDATEPETQTAQAVEPDSTDDAANKQVIAPEQAEETPEIMVTPTATPTLTQAPATAALATYDANALAQCSLITPVSAAATSSIVQEGTDNGPMMMVDGDINTNWEEGVDGSGIGERVTFQFDTSHEVQYLTFKLGNWKTEEYYTGNNKPQTLTLSFDNQAFQITFPSDKEEFMVALSQPVTSTTYTIQIDSVYRGSQWDDTVITDLAIYGK